MKRACMVVGVVLSWGCGGDDSGVLTTTLVGTGTSTTFGDSGSGDDDSGGDGPVDECHFPLPGAGSYTVRPAFSSPQSAETVVPGQVCDVAGIVTEEATDNTLGEDQEFPVFVYYPEKAGGSSGDWPDEPRPAVFLMPGNGHWFFDHLESNEFVYDAIVDGCGSSAAA